LDEATRHALARGRRVREILKQPQAQPIPAAEQVAVLLAVTEGVLDGVPVEQIQAVTAAIQAATRRHLGAVCDAIAAGAPLTPADEAALLKGAIAVVQDTAPAAETPGSSADRPAASPPDRPVDSDD
jgi:F-type H+-transporting ATPase subunit alpha